MPVDIGLIQFYLHPPLGFLYPHVDLNGPYSGVQTLPTWSGGPVSNTYGLVWQPSGPTLLELGYVDGWVSPDGQNDAQVYYQRLVQIVVQHQLPSGAWVTSQQLDSHQYKELILWSESLPGRIGLWIVPGMAIDLYYLNQVP